MTGWKHAASDAPQVISELRAVREQLSFDLREIIVLGMGGSALAAYVLRSFFPSKVTIRVVDTTAPAYVKRVLEEMDGAHTLLIIASKSGTTIEPTVLSHLFQQRLEQQLGSKKAAALHCIALTDPDTALGDRARKEGWLAVVLTSVAVGGRYSALTAFGLAPLVLAGPDNERELELLIARAQKAESQSGNTQLTDFLIMAADSGRDVVLLVLPPELVTVGRWLEQLIAESLGKDGRGLIPVITTPERAEELLLFSSRARAVTTLVTIGDGGLLARVRGTADALDIPAFDYPFCEPDDLGTLFVDWEFAIAHCGGHLGVNPFDQPDVAASKVATNRILAGKATNAQDEKILLRPLAELRAAVADRTAHYLALLAWLPYSKENDELLQQQAHELERTYGLPVALCYGPRYLHSTGQGYKGGPATGLFLFAGDGGSVDLLIPDYGFTLAQLFAAQRQGDIEILKAKGRPLFGPLARSV